MNKKELLELGFTQNESEVYCSLVKFNLAKANELIKDTKLHKKIVYENLERLIDKGLVSFVQEGRTRIFKVADPNMLVELFEEKIKDAEEKKKSAERIASEIRLIVKKEKLKQEATLFRGKKGIRSFYNELIRSGEDYIVFGAPGNSIEIMGEHFWLNLVNRKNEKKIKAKILFNLSLKKYGEKIIDKSTTVRYLRKDFEPLTEINIQKDRVATIVWSEEPVLFLIKDRIVAESYLLYFEKMWSEAKEKNARQ
ncbi:MAG: helix-turn-helix domain-containing protein [Candidatus Woesearchaeota archaeon]|jgi:sugar-specific transcriptional regulator TrmB